MVGEAKECHPLCGCPDPERVRLVSVDASGPQALVQLCTEVVPCDWFPILELE